MRGASLTVVLFTACSVFPDAAPSLGGHTNDADAGAGGSSREAGGSDGSSGSGGAAAAGSGAPDADSPDTDSPDADSLDADSPDASRRDATVADDASAPDATIAADAARLDASDPSDGASRDAADPPDALVSQRFDYAPSVVACRDDIRGTPAECTAAAQTAGGANQILIDLRQTNRREFSGYLSFPLDNAFAGQIVTAVLLEVTVADGANAGGDSPEVFEVEPFLRSTLATLLPATVGPALAGPLGPAAAGATITYSLPIDRVSPNGTLYLMLAPAGTNDILLWDAAGAAPPRLIIETQLP